MKDISIKWYPQPKQLAMLKAVGLAHWFDPASEPGPPAARIVGYGGAAGGGKSDCLVIIGILTALTYAGSQTAYFRRTFPELEGPGGAISRSFAILGPMVRAKLVKWQAQQHRWLFINGSVIQFCHLQNETDQVKYQSQQFDCLLIDECTHFEEDMVQFLLSRNRLTVNMPRAICAMATNPGGPGHHWFRRLFVVSGPPESVNASILNNGGVTTYFVPAKLADNAVLESRDPQYRATLEALPEHLRQQLLEGNWDAFAGQVFSEFDPLIHIVRPFDIPKWWRRWRSNDPGFTDPFSWYWFAADPDGTVYVYREYTRSPNDPRVAYSEQAREVDRLSFVGTEVPGQKAEVAWNEEEDRYTPVKENISYTVTGMDAFNAHPETGKAHIDYYAEGGVNGCIKPVHGPGARAQMAATVHEYLRVFPGPDGKPTARLKIFNTCKALLDTLPMLTADELHPEQVAESSIDHWYQGMGYGLQSHHVYRSEEPPKPEYMQTREERIWRHKKKLAKSLALKRRWG